MNGLTIELNESKESFMWILEGLALAWTLNEVELVEHIYRDLRKAQRER